MHPEVATPWYRTIRFRLVVIVLLIQSVMLALLLANSYRLMNNSFESQTRVRIQALAPLLDAALAGLMFQRDHSEITSVIRKLTGSELAGLRYIVVVDAHGEVLASSGEVTLELLQNTAPVDASISGALADQTFDTSLQISLYDNPVGAVRFGLSLDDQIALRNANLQQSFAIVFIAILLSMLLLMGAGFLVTRHITDLVAATRRIASADYSTPIAITSQDEVGLLADNFNVMAATVQNRIEQLAESETRFRTIFDAAGDAIFIHDPETGRTLDVNLRMCEMFGCTHAQALGVSLADLSTNVKPFTQVEATENLRLAREKGPQTFDWLARRMDDGRQFWVEVNLRRTSIGSTDRIIALVRDITERKRYQHELEFLAHHDPLTQLPNRILFADRLQLAMVQTQRSQRLLAIAYLDLDAFKSVNDQHGHEIGDRLLIKVAQRLKDTMRAGDSVCRLGGDEFALLLDDLTSIDECTQALQRLLDAIALPYHIETQEVQISGSIGVTLYPLDDADTDTLMRHADQAMYVAKQTGRNRFHLFDTALDRQTEAQHNARTRIEAALVQDEFVLFYQPKVNMGNGDVFGAEALIRWQHPEEGLIPPGRFLPVVEDSNFAIPLGEWVIDTALKQLAAWRKAGLLLTVSVNISARHLQSPNFSEQLASILARHPDVPPAALELEIVESVALEDMALVARVIDACHALGVKFALDDFGTGYSSLSYFKRLKVDVLKIDQSFVRDLLTDEEDHAIVEGVISLTRAFKREVIAEGVETVEIGAALLALGCPLAQGYGIARPMPAADLPGWIASWRPDPRWVSALNAHPSQPPLKGR
ncbi:MAG: EAL domain-containing protein [Gammaproteobacteria bacterium]|nr:EAL domain-containing protein [Rhodocyclaceae bacterium]MBU3907659.1 EAL domain-containing protein [Gammaproteobacteria bacterium]MBU3989204.1 EAL domain-containing protein [Gammaproteobacteria bacterium]MBU4004305.1 EAL domain-containing protein [Gammaproteobacteria bacterium]MBU4019714.1 EAL domain-containing protein [Gammaproteobacteria bacterium]